MRWNQLLFHHYTTFLSWNSHHFLPTTQVRVSRVTLPLFCSYSRLHHRPIILYQTTSFLYNGHTKLSSQTATSILQKLGPQKSIIFLVFRSGASSIPLIRSVPLKGRSLIVREEIAILIPTKEIVLFDLHKLWLVSLLGFAQNRF